jgi:hypothetical protein
MCKPTNSLSWLNADMATLQERLTEVMAAMHWEHADLVRVSGQSSSVVSQWRGKSSKLIKSIGNMAAAQRIEAASGFCALWVAKGEGPKLLARADRTAYSRSNVPASWHARMAHLTPEQLDAVRGAVEAMLASFEAARSGQPRKPLAASA